MHRGRKINLSQTESPHSAQGPLCHSPQILWDHPTKVFRATTSWRAREEKKRTAIFMIIPTMPRKTPAWKQFTLQDFSGVGPGEQMQEKNSGS